MASHTNFKNFGDPMCNDAITQKPKVGSFPLSRQSSVYSLTFEEFQNTWGGGLGKDFGSMNMDELLKNIWTAEESQSMPITTNNNGNNNNNQTMAGNNGGFLPGGNLQRQGSITLPRTLSQKTVDEVWRDLMKEPGSGNSNANVPQRQPTLGEVTLEEFLVRAGVVREDPPPKAVLNNDNGGFFSFGNGTNTGFAQNNNNGFLYTNASINNHPSGLTVNTGGVRPPLPLPQQQESRFPKQANVAFANPMSMMNGTQLTMQGPRNSVNGVGDCTMNMNLAQAVDIKSGVTVAAVSPGGQISPVMTPPKNNADSSSLSPVPFVYGRGRKSGGALEKVIERRQRRMIKNRESAARSRARKQAYTLELEAEVAKLKELNEELQRKQAEIMEMKKNQLSEPMKQQWGCKRQCLRRTLTGPW